MPTSPGTIFLTFDPSDVELVQAFTRRHSRALPVVRTIGVTPGDEVVDNSDDRRIIEEVGRRYIGSADLAIALIGERTWTRRFVDWELAAAADRGCAVIGVPLTQWASPMPARLQLLAETGRASIYERPPVDADELQTWMKETGERMSRARSGGRALHTPLLRQDARVDRS